MPSTVPETPLRLTDSCEIEAFEEAARVNVPGELVVAETEVGVAVTPVGSPESVTVTLPLNPFCGTTETWNGWPGAPCVRVRLPGAAET